MLASRAVGTMGAEPAPARGGAVDYAGPVRWSYRPELDREPDPGEIVWAWVAYEDQPAIGKDRPLAVIGHAADGRLAALMLSSRDHRGEANWLSVGAGPWDRQGRVSWVRTDRVLAVPAEAVRREGAILPRPVFDSLAGALGAGPASGVPRHPLLDRLRGLVRRR